MSDTTVINPYLSEIEKMMLLDKAIKETLSNMEKLNKCNSLQLLYLILVKELCDSIVPITGQDLTITSMDYANRIMNLYITGLDIKYKEKPFRIDFLIQPFQNTYVLILTIKSFLFEEKENFFSIEENINILDEEFIEKEKIKIKTMLDCIYNKTINFENFFNLLRKRIEIDE